MRKMCRYVSEMCGRKLARIHVFMLNRESYMNRLRSSYSVI